MNETSLRCSVNLTLRRLIRIPRDNLFDESSLYRRAKWGCRVSPRTCLKTSTTLLCAYRCFPATGIAQITWRNNGKSKSREQIVTFWWTAEVLASGFSECRIFVRSRQYASTFCSQKKSDMTKLYFQRSRSWNTSWNHNWSWTLWTSHIPVAFLYGYQFLYSSKQKFVLSGMHDVPSSNNTHAMQNVRARGRRWSCVLQRKFAKFRCLVARKSQLRTWCAMTANYIWNKTISVKRKSSILQSYSLW